ncbi:hypothetical protein ACVIWV_002307 [Bradyrhizobium diazoefficiens]|uniref:hypothetical protein n=1 Tax=Bradyrhizobium TaxID=374 RepID=UPI002011EC9A|nr:hypothetical protein [Bradyrhizobium diazoefficiens]
MKMTRMRALFCVLLATTAIGGGAAANSQARDSMWDSSQLPESRGTVKQYTLTPRGDIDGVILTDGTEVKLPPHLTAQTVFAIHPGDEVSIRGLRARALPLVDAASITNIATGKSVVDNGPPDRRVGNEDQVVSGRIAAQLHGKRGEVNGVLLDDGTTLRLPPPEAERMQDQLRRGQTVSARGDVLDTVFGRVVDVRAIGASPEQMTESRGPRPPGPPDGPDRRGPPPPPPPPGFGPPPPPRG